MFGNLIPVSWFVQQCIDIFGPQFNASAIANNVAWTNTVYGGKDVEGSNILFPNGSIDPWHALGIISDISASEQAVYIQVRIFECLCVCVGENIALLCWAVRSPIAVLGL